MLRCSSGPPGLPGIAVLIAPLSSAFSTYTTCGIHQCLQAYIDSKAQGKRLALQHTMVLMVALCNSMPTHTALHQQCFSSSTAAPAELAC